MVREFSRIAALYAVIAALATVVNIACQALLLLAWRGPFAIELSVLAGTAAGLPIKYALEKRHIFGFRTRDLRQDGRLFLVYGLFGVFTTGLFWGTEYAFHVAFATDSMRYVGAAIGLGLGYVVRYQIDKRFVFVHARRAPQPA